MGLLILVGAIIVVGVVIALRSPSSQGSSTTSAQEPGTSSGGESSPTLGLWCFVGGLAAAAGVAMVGQATFGWLPAFDPPGWLRIVTFWMLPAGVVASAILGALSLKRNSGRTLGVTGLALALLSVGAFFAMLVSVDY